MDIVGGEEIHVRLGCPCRWKAMAVHNAYGSHMNIKVTYGFFSVLLHLVVWFEVAKVNEVMYFPTGVSRLALS